MWIVESFEVVEMFKNGFPYSFLFFLPIIMLITPVNSAQSFPVYRAQHFDLASNTYGSRNTLVNMEARPMDAGMISRKCIIVRVGDLTLAKYRYLLEQGAGAVIILLPDALEKLHADIRKQFSALEQALVTEETQIPVYFAIENAEILEIYQQVLASDSVDSSASATAALLQAVSANGFQLNVNTNSAQVISDFKAINIHGLLEGSGNADRLPTLVITAHYDSYGAVPALAFGADSNGSGVAALLELVRIFSRLYSSVSSRPAYNIVFLLSGAGKFNYFGTKKWLEEMKDSNKFPFLSDVEAVVCLDSLATAGPLRVHVSKPPKDGSAAETIFKYMKELAVAAGSSVELIHKKIFLAEPQLAWEHEQFAMHRLPGFSVSSLDNHKSPQRGTILDVRSSVDSTALALNTYIIGEAVARFLFDVTSTNHSVVDVLKEDLAIQRGMLDAWLDVLTADSRAAQHVNAKHTVLASLEHAMNRYLRAVERTAYSPDKKDPELVLYGNTVDTVHVYNVKPAVFDLVLSLFIAAYLGTVYLVSQSFPLLVTMMTASSKLKKA